jgi:hypothetical protein
MVARVCGWQCISDANDENFDEIHCFYIKSLNWICEVGAYFRLQMESAINVLSPYVFSRFVSPSSVHLSLPIKPEQSPFLPAKSSAPLFCRM